MAKCSVTGRETQGCDGDRSIRNRSLTGWTPVLVGLLAALSGVGCGGGGIPLEECAAATYDDDGDPDTACVAWTVCRAGEYVSAAGVREERVEAGDPRSAAMIKILLAWVDERYSADQQRALSAESRDAHMSAYGGGVVRIATTPGMRAASLADSTSPCGPMALGDSTYVWVDWPEATEDVAWFILSKFRVTPEGR